MSALLLQQESVELRQQQELDASVYYMDRQYSYKKEKCIIIGKRVVRYLSFCGLYCVNNVTDIGKLVHKMIVLKR